MKASIDSQGLLFRHIRHARSYTLASQRSVRRALWDIVVQLSTKELDP